MAVTCEETCHKRKSLSIEEKIIIIERLASGERQIDIAEELDVNKSTIASIYRCRENILKSKEVLETCEGNLKRKRFRGVEDSPLENELFCWFQQQRDAGVHVTGSDLKEKALELNKMYNGNDNFKASNGWLQKFKNRKGIRCWIQSEKKSADYIAGERFKLELANFVCVMDVGLDRIYNCNVTGLYWKMLPSETLGSKNGRCTAEKKKLRDRITVMTCTNASGTHKVPLYVIGKNGNPRCFENIKSLPVNYESQKNACMDRTLMLDWYQNIFLPEVKMKHDCSGDEGIKILLIMDDVPFHPSAEEFNEICDFCSVMFLPANVTSLVQPLDQGVIEQFKRNYKKLFLSKIYINGDNVNVDNALQEFTLLDCLRYCLRAWAAITPNSIRHCWKDLIPLTEPSSASAKENSIDLASFHSFLSKMPGYDSITLKETRKFLNADKNEDGWACTGKDEELSSDNYQSPTEVADEKEESNDELEISIEKAYESLMNLMKYYKTNVGCSDNTFKVLDDLDQKMVAQIISKKYL